MVKKIFSVMILAAALIFIGNNQAEAREVYVGSYSDGTRVYVLTETIKNNFRNSSISCMCTVRAGNDYLKYVFEGYQYSNSEGYEGNINDGKSPVAKAIYNFCMSY